MKEIHFLQNNGNHIQDTWHHKQEDHKHKYKYKNYIYSRHKLIPNSKVKMKVIHLLQNNGNHIQGTWHHKQHIHCQENLKSLTDQSLITIQLRKVPESASSFDQCWCITWTCHCTLFKF